MPMPQPTKAIFDAATSMSPPANSRHQDKNRRRAAPAVSQIAMATAAGSMTLLLPILLICIHESIETGTSNMTETPASDDKNPAGVRPHPLFYAALDQAPVLRRG